MPGRRASFLKCCMTLWSFGSSSSNFPGGSFSRPELGGKMGFSEVRAGEVAVLVLASEQLCRCLKRERCVRKRDMQFSHLEGMKTEEAKQSIQVPTGLSTMAFSFPAERQAHVCFLNMRYPKNEDCQILVGTGESLYFYPTFIIFTNHSRWWIYPTYFPPLIFPTTIP